MTAERWADTPPACICRWLARVSEPGWVLERPNPQCRAVHEENR